MARHISLLLAGGLILFALLRNVECGEKLDKNRWQQMVNKKQKNRKGNMHENKQ